MELTFTMPCTGLKDGSGTKLLRTTITGGAPGILSGQDLMMTLENILTIMMTGGSTGSTSTSEHLRPLRLISICSLSR